MKKFIRFPGLIDIHVHLRDPGQNYKEDFYTGTFAALAGGVTAVFDMPNNTEPIYTAQKLREKREIVKQKALCDWSLYFGTDGKNTDQFEKVVDEVIGLKVYLELTTGKLIIEDEKLVENVFNSWPNTKVIIIHAEERKIDLALELAGKYKNKIHITHVNTKSLLDKILQAKKEGINATCDTTPNYLFLDVQEGEKLGSFGGIKPPLASKKDVEYLWSNLDKIDCIATDHAPHTINDKKSENPPTGFPGLETTLPLLLTAVSEGKISIDDVVRLTNTNPQKIFNFHQDKNTFVEVDSNEEYIINNNDLKTKCGWSPFAGWKVKGRVKNTYIRGTKVFSGEKILVNPGFGRNVLL